jgi:hypothetical protein
MAREYNKLFNMLTYVHPIFPLSRGKSEALIPEEGF